eukprot:6242970-Amphidinium_carterae.1
MPCMFSFSLALQSEGTSAVSHILCCTCVCIGFSCVAKLGRELSRASCVTPCADFASHVLCCTVFWVTRTFCLALECSMVTGALEVERDLAKSVGQSVSSCSPPSGQPGIASTLVLSRAADLDMSSVPVSRRASSTGAHWPTQRPLSISGAYGPGQQQGP